MILEGLRNFGGGLNTPTPPLGTPLASSPSKGLTTTDHNMLFSSKLQGLCSCPCISLPLLWLTKPQCPKISLTWGCQPLLNLSTISSYKERIMHGHDRHNTTVLSTIHNTGWRKRNQQDATNLVFIIKLLSQHVSGFIMSIFRRTRLCYCSNSNLHIAHTACSPTPHNQYRTPFAVIHSLVLLKMGIMMPGTCWDRSLIINTRIVSSCWFLFLHPPTFMMHGHKSIQYT